MSTKQKEEQIIPAPPIFDPFPEPITMPAGWDLSSLVSDFLPASSSQGDPNSSTDDMAIEIT